MRITKLTLVLTVLLFSGSVIGQCPDPELVCPFFGPLVGLECTYEGAACEGKDCKGANLGEEFKVVPTGRYYNKWIIMHEGAEDVTGYTYPCGLTEYPGVTHLELDDTKCAFTLVTETGLYMEHFASNPDTGCFGWIECPCVEPLQQ